MTKEEFKKRWESGEDGGGITYNDIATCARKWGLSQTPERYDLEHIRYKVLKEANTEDYEAFDPWNPEYVEE